MFAYIMSFSFIRGGILNCFINQQSKWDIIKAELEGCVWHSELEQKEISIGFRLIYIYKKSFLISSKGPNIETSSYFADQVLRLQNKIKSAEWERERGRKGQVNHYFHMTDGSEASLRFKKFFIYRFYYRWRRRRKNQKRTTNPSHQNKKLYEDEAQQNNRMFRGMLEISIVKFVRSVCAYVMYNIASI